MKPIFSGNLDFNKSAYLNWRTGKNEGIQNMLVLADGYIRAAIELSNICLTDNSDKKADILIFPILNNANHGIELYLKSLNLTLSHLLNIKEEVNVKHNIKELLKNVKSKLKEYKGQSMLDHFNQQTEGLEEYIEDLFTINEATDKKDNMDFSRYPSNFKNENYFYVNEIEKNITIDLENFAGRFESIGKGLDGISAYLFHQELNQDW